MTAAELNAVLDSIIAERAHIRATGAQPRAMAVIAPSGNRGAL
jgi:hypothetical protein